MIPSVHRSLSTASALAVTLALPGAPGNTEDRFFKEDFHAGALYLKLGADGSYEVVDREHMGVWISERGRWHELDDGTLLFVSDRYVSDVASDVGRVVLRGDDARALLPSLRSRLSKLLEDVSGSESLAATSVGSVDVVAGESRVQVDLAESVIERGTVSREEVQSLLNAIDAFLLSQLRHRTRRRIHTHRGITYLVSLETGVHAPVLDAREVRERIDELDGRVPACVLAEIAEAVFRQEIRTTYPFRFLRRK